MNKMSDIFPHGLVLIVCLPLIFGGLFIKTNELGHCVWSSSGERIPSSCVFRFVTGIDCPGCGMTRCFVSMTHGQFAKAWKYHPWGVAFYLFLCTQIPYRLFQIYRIGRGQEPVAVPCWTELLVCFLLLYFLQWFLRLGGVLAVTGSIS